MAALLTLGCGAAIVSASDGVLPVAGRSAAASPSSQAASSGEAKLKWKPYRSAKPDLEAPSVVQHPVEAQPLRPAVAEQREQTRPSTPDDEHLARAKRRSEILPVSAQQQEDPFKDPFGDVPLKSRRSTSAVPIAQQPSLAQPTPAEALPPSTPQPISPPAMPPAPLLQPESTPPSTLPGQEPLPTPFEFFDKGSSTVTDDRPDCAGEYSRLKLKTINNIELDINVSGKQGDDYPWECSLGNDQFQPRSWACTTYQWKASGLCHKPLYFEDVQLERYGHSHKPLTQMVLSGAHFFAALPALPYMMGLCPPDECQYTLGYYRPGSCAPYLIDPIPFSLRAALFEAGAITGGILLIP